LGTRIAASDHRKKREIRTEQQSLTKGKRAKRREDCRGSVSKGDVSGKCIKNFLVTQN